MTPVGVMTAWAAPATPEDMAREIASERRWGEQAPVAREAPAFMRARDLPLNMKPAAVAALAPDVRPFYEERQAAYKARHRAACQAGNAQWRKSRAEYERLTDIDRSVARAQTERRVLDEGERLLFRMSTLDQQRAVAAKDRGDCGCGDGPGCPHVPRHVPAGTTEEESK